MDVGTSEVANYVNTFSGTATGVVAYGGVGGVDEINSFFSALNWFSKGEPGAWYDPSDISINWRRNLLTYTEDFSNAAWSTIDSVAKTNNYTSAPDGTLTAGRIVFATNNNGNQFFQSQTTTANSYTQTIWLKIPSGTGNIMFGIYDGAIKSSSIPLTTQWQQFTYPYIAVTPGSTRTLWLYPNNTEDMVTEIHIWHPQVEQSSSASVYQKITDGVQDYYTVQPQPVLFQDAAGTIPITYIEQPVGLMLDKSKGLALGAELVTNGDFSNGTTGWTAYTLIGGLPTLSVVSGNLRITNNASTGRGSAYQVITTAVGVTYRINITGYDGSSPANSAYIRVGTSAGDYTFGSIQLPNAIVRNIIFTATTTTTYLTLNNILDTANIYIEFDNISVKQIAGNHAFQATSGNKPLLSARVNLLTKTEDFSDWVKGTGVNVATTSVVAPNGTLTVSKYYLSNLQTSGPTSQLSKGPFTGVANMKFSCYVKSAGATGSFVIQDGAGNGSTLDLSTWQISSNISNGIGTVIPLPDGWYIFTVTTTSTNPYFYTYFSGSTGDGVSGIYIWGADLRPTNSGTLLPAYQRVNTASDYDTVGFPLYLACNGTVSSRSMSTNSIDFTSTDKMTVVTGVRKLSDATRGMIAELSASLDTNNGSFNISGSFPNATANYRYESKGTLVSSADCGTGYIAPINNVLTTQSYIATDADNMRVNGTLVATSPADQGTGNFGNYPFYLFARAGTSLPFNGNFYGAIIRGAQSDTASVVQTENYMAVKTGIVIASMMGDSKIGVAGTQGFGVGIAPVLPAGFSEMDGTRLLGSANYGNYQYTDGSVMCWIPAFYYKIGTGSNGLALNAVDIKDYSYYADVATANTAGYALHRAFYNAGVVQTGVFVDKYQCSNNAGIASSIKMGNPLSCALVHNPFSGLTGLVVGDNILGGAFKAAKTRGTKFFCNSRFIFSALALLSLAHAQAATSTTACAWYDAAGIINFPKGNNNNALKDANDATVTYITDGYPNCGQTGSASNLAKTAHNGQSCGVVDLNGNLWEINTGFISNGTNYYLLKTSVDINALTGGNALSTDAWGAASITANYDLLGATYGGVTASNTAKTVGAATQVFDAATSGTAWSATSSGIPLLTGIGGTNIMGNDVLYDYRPNEMCALAGGHWSIGASAGVWALSLADPRAGSGNYVGFRSALYL